MALTYSFPDLEPVSCSMSNSNCCFSTCIQISQEAGQVVWYSHFLKNFPQFVVIHTVTPHYFGIVNKAKVDVSNGFLDHSHYNMHVCVYSVISWFFATPKDWGSPSSSVHVDSPGKNTAVGSHSFCRGSLLPRDWTCLLHWQADSESPLSRLGSPVRI